MSNTVGSRNSNFDVAYEAVRDNMVIDALYEWDDLASSFFNLEVPAEGDYKEQMVYVLLRNRILKAINERCTHNMDNWRIYVESIGKTIVKKENKEMINSEMVKRMTRVASAMNLILNNLKPMIGADGIDGKDRKVLRQMRSLALGASMSIRGGIVSMPGFTKSQKLMLTSKLPSEDGDVE